jgi:hypothetical protein
MRAAKRRTVCTRTNKVNLPILPPFVPIVPNKKLARMANMARMGDSTGELEQRLKFLITD